jgi:hypothetical protein
MHLLAELEIVVNGVAGREHDGRVIHYTNFLLAEFPARKTLNLDKGAKHQFYIILLRNVEIR